MSAGMCSLQSLQGSFCFTSFSQLLMSLAILGVFYLVGVCVCVCVCVCQLLSCVQLFATPWTVAFQVPLSMGFSRQGYWSGLPLPSCNYMALISLCFYLLQACRHSHCLFSLCLYLFFPLIRTPVMLDLCSQLQEEFN